MPVREQSGRYPISPGSHGNNGAILPPHGHNPAMIGPAVKLGREWRVFVVHEQQVTGCEYANRGIPEAITSLPSEVTDFVAQTLRVFTPAPCFVIDVAEVFSDSGSTLKVVEYNSINSSGFYACDKTAVVEELSKFALSNFGN